MKKKDEFKNSFDLATPLLTSFPYLHHLWWVWRLVEVAALNYRSGRRVWNRLVENWNLDSTKIKYVSPRETSLGVILWREHNSLIVQDRELVNEPSNLPLVIPLISDSVVIWIWCSDSKGFFSFTTPELCCSFDELLRSRWGVIESLRQATHWVLCYGIGTCHMLQDRNRHVPGLTLV